MARLSFDQKMHYITRNLDEILGMDELKILLNQRDPKIYWGTATTGKPHIAYLLPLLKIKDFIDAGCEVKILLADIYAFLDNLKASFNEIESRTKYYKILVEVLLNTQRVKDGYSFIKGSDFQKKKGLYPRPIQDMFSYKRKRC